MISDMMGRLQMKGQNLYLGLGILSLFLVFIFIHVKIRHGKECVIIQETYHPVPLYLRAVDDRGDQNVLVLQTTLMKQRNAMSKQMNEMSKQQGQKDCEAQKGSGSRTASTGGWCRDQSKEDSGSHMTDMNLVPALSNFFENKKVASFGDGPGAYKREILKLGKVSAFDSYDGAPYTETTSEGRVAYLDLTLPQFGLPLYDWVMSLEVAEHIPSKFENVYMDNIARHSKEGIVLSWATPGQGGLEHINERSFEYVINLLQTYDFEWDEKSSYYLRNASTLPWLRANVNVFKRKTDKYMNIVEHWYL